MKVSALAITFNEAEHLEEFISQMSFADEIIIIDSFSNDETSKIVNAKNVTFLQREFRNFSDQKNYALSQVSNDWVVFFDPDEKLSPGLIEEIKNTINNPKEKVAFKVKRNFYFMGRKLKYSGFQNDSVIRVFNKNFCQYNGSLVHETIESNGEIGILKHSLNHYSYKNFDAFNTKLTHYASLQAEKLYKQNKRPNLFHFLVRPWYRFMHQYFLRLGFLDGKEGFILAYLQGFSVFKRYIILWTKYRNIE